MDSTTTITTTTTTTATTRLRSFANGKPNGMQNGQVKGHVKIKPFVKYTPPTKGFLSLLPSSWVPYAQLMRLDKPAGFYAFYFPYLMGLSYGACIAQETIPPSTLLRQSSFFLLWCIILRGAACTWNDNIDQDFDRAVARCRLRPIARRAVSTPHGHMFTVAQCLAGGALLWWQGGRLSVECTYDVIPIAVLFGIYPFGKRFTNYPQFILGFPFAAAIFMACHALTVDPLTTGPTFAATVCLFMANVLWTMIYDTIYAHQDIKDDIKAGVKSMAVRFKDSTKLVASTLGVVQVSLLVTVGHLTEMAPVYYAVTCGGTALSLAAMIGLVDLETPASCAWWFKMDFWFVGASVVGGFLGQYSLQLL
jgi:4-hydroxybenzoate polyprenyltransferase